MEQFLPFDALNGFAIIRIFLQMHMIFGMLMIIDRTAWYAVLFPSPCTEVDHLAAF
jgi:hypothetical protein